MQKKPDIPYSQEIFRKGIHLSSLSIPIIYSFIERQTALWILAALFAPALAVDLLRHFVPSVKRFVSRFFGGMMRKHELDDKRLLLSGATYVLMSALLCVFIFPKIVAVTAFAVMIVSDICSALVGRKFGKRRFLDKSLEGTTAFWVSAFAVVGAIAAATGAPWQYIASACAASVVGGIVEAASIRLHMDDNLSVPLGTGFCLWALILVAFDPPMQRALLGLL